jgi:hypothetical protein
LIGFIVRTSVLPVLDDIKADTNKGIYIIL